MKKFLKVVWGIFAVIGIHEEGAIVTTDADTFWAAPVK